MINLKGAFLLYTFLGSSIMASSLSKCPSECTCDLDPSGRYYTACLNGNMENIPLNELDNKMEIILIQNPKHTLQIGHLFTDFKKLEVLRIVDSNVPAIGMYSFWGVPSLRLLDLSRNNISHIYDDNFKGQQNLIELNLSTNKMERIPSGTFKYLTNLRVLNLANNLLEELVPRLFQQLTKLKSLDLSGNPLENLTPDVFRDIMDLKILKCRRCGLKRVNQHVYHLLVQLTDLDIGNNQFQYFEKDEFEALKNLRRLNLDRNHLVVIVDKLFSSQKSLEFLDVSHNRLAKISSEAFVNLSNLTYLDISYNKIADFEFGYMSHLSKLRILNISGNFQMNLFDSHLVFESLTELRSLSIADFSNLPSGLFVPLSNLQMLNISGTYLGNETTQTLDPIKKLKELDLSRNQLRGFDDELVEKLLKIENVKFDENPFICDLCNIEAILKHQKEIKWKNMPTCFQPEKLRGIPINRLKRNNLEPCWESQFSDEGRDSAITSYNFLHESQINLLAFIGSSIFVLLLLIIIFSISICTRQRAHYYTREDRKEPTTENCLESSLITGSEINFKFPLDDRSVYSIEEVCFQPPPNRSFNIAKPS